MSEASSEKQAKRKTLYIIIMAVIASALLCSLVIGGIGVFSLARNTIPADMPVDIAGVWERQGNIFAFCSNSQFPRSLVISEEGNYSGPGGNLWQGGDFQVLIGERVRVKTNQGDKYYKYELLVLEDSSFLTFSTGFFNNCRVSYFRFLELNSE
ncbi:MAG: hypothetical protein DWQ07_03265 [Chloroflexi bacterium]|nr:MAG: hypothetical protein DWQ07_03265 [Chloroflexota bacterium]MBL1193480.1 hypothetical protein [Chloroflexota bacterium]NOH10771.1 hypothetical protein [Chloroflexota bacterium]